MKDTRIRIGIIGLLLAVLVYACYSGGGHSAAMVAGKLLPDVVDYNFHVKPILSDRCFACHGPDEAKRGADLRLDTQEGLFGKVTGGGYAVVPGKPNKSKILDRIHSTDPDLVMPPPEAKLTISDYEIALIERWIDQGAEWKQHWSFIPPQKAEFPAVQQVSWVKNEIDPFVLAKIEREGFTPNNEAEKEALIRRVTFDLTGLPPTLEEIDAFLEDDSAGAYERLVDRLLADHHYGERMAADWLVVSRYGDTHGYEADSERRSWPWRDWVIEAFNQNMPYDQFITEQLAGDLLPNPTREQLIATSFNRNHLMNSENGIIDEEFRVEYVSDRTNTAGKALLGLTMECAKCHDHKYDPITQKEYFSLYAFFNNVAEDGQIRYATNAAPILHLTTPQEDKVLTELEVAGEKQLAEIGSYIQSLESNTDWAAKVDKSAIDLEKDLMVHVTFDKVIETRDGKYFPNEADPTRNIFIENDEILVDGPIGKAMEYDGVNGTIIKDAKSSFESFESFSHAVWMNFPEPFPDARIFGTEDGTFDKVPGLYVYVEEDKIGLLLCNTWDYNFIQLRTKESIPFKKWMHLAVTYDGSSKASGLKIYLDGAVAEVEVLKDNLNKNLNSLAWYKIGHDSFQGGQLDDFRQYRRVLTVPEIRTLARQEIRSEDWLDYYVHFEDDRLKALRDALSQTIRQRVNLLDTVDQLMVMGDLQDSVRPTYVLDRGIYDSPTDEVWVNTPAAVLPFSEELPQNRLGLSQWLFQKGHPLTARVMVNRIWQMFMGKGLVATPDDFGNQGSLPTHPELLDWLAVDFEETGWDMKVLIKKIVMSATYRQSSKVQAELLEIDPNNDLLARSPRYRLPAEMIRDNALALSGLLVDSLGGPPVKPYQPPGLWAQVSSTRTPYVQDHGDNLYRRSLYTYWKRAVPPPNMTTFDAPTRHTCTVKTESTSTPLQSLVLLNDVQFVEAARVFAERILSDENQDEDRIRKAFRMTTSRMPKAEELAVFRALLEESRNSFQSNPADAKALIAMGEYPVGQGIDQLELAAYTIVTSAILNLNESISKS